jgi:hypothetical protein
MEMGIHGFGIIIAVEKNKIMFGRRAFDSGLPTVAWLAAFLPASFRGNYLNYKDYL